MTVEEATKFLNKQGYVAVPISKGQLCLCDSCEQDESRCRYGAYGYTCSNLLCMNKYIKTQLKTSE